VEVRWVSGANIKVCSFDDVEALKAGPGFLWCDVPAMTPENAAVLSDRLGLDTDLIGGFGERTVIPKVDQRDGKLFLLLHSLDAEGHLLQLGIAASTDAIVTVHGPLTEGVPFELAMRDVRATEDRIRNGRSPVSRPVDVAAVIIDSISDWLTSLLTATSGRAGALDRRLREGSTGDPEEFLQQAFAVRHQLLTVANRASQTRGACQIAASMATELFGDDAGFAHDALLFDRLRNLSDGEKEFLQGILDFYESQVNTKMNIAMERLAVIAAVALPITAIGGIVGMNTIVNTETDFIWTIAIIALMVFFGVAMLTWAKKKGWW
jgi:magnesium transporter